MSKTAKHYGLTFRTPSERHFKATYAINKQTGLLLPLAYRAFIYEKDDFFGSTMNGDLWTTAADAGAPPAVAFAIPATKIAGGAIRGSSGALSGSFTSVRGAPVLLGDKYGGVDIRWRVSNAANLVFEMGLINAVTDATLPVVTDVDTPAVGNGGTDIAVMHLDSSQTLTTAAFVTEGATAGMVPVKSNLGTFTPAVDTWYWTRVALVGDEAHCWVLDTEGDSILAEAHKDVDSDHRLEGGTLVMPWFIGGARAAANKDYDIDAIVQWMER